MATQEVPRDRSGWFLGMGVFVLIVMVIVIGALLNRTGDLSLDLNELRSSVVTFQFESQIEELAISSQTIRQDQINTYLKRLNIFPLEDKIFIGTGRVESDLSSIKVKFLPLGQLETDKHADPMFITSRSLLRNVNERGETIIYYFLGKLQENGRVLEIPVYVDTELISQLSSEGKLSFVTETILFVTYANFDRLTVDGTIYQNFIEEVGDFESEPVLGHKMGGLSNLVVWLLRRTVKPVFAQVCAGTITCGSWVFPGGRCSQSGRSCSSEAQCPGFSNICVKPPPYCNNGEYGINCGGSSPCGYGVQCSPSSCNQSGSCYVTCTPNCSGRVCGQSNGCGGSCPTTGFNNWSGWSCGPCGNPGSCGNVVLSQNCTRTNQCGGTQSMSQACGGACNECGPTVIYNPAGPPACGPYTRTTNYDCRTDINQGFCTECGPAISAWSAWSACTAPSFTRTRTRTCTENCGTDNCAGVPLSETEPCRGSVNGIFFDASNVSNCAAVASLPKIAGAGVQLAATVNHSSTYNSLTDAGGAFNQTGLPIPEVYNLYYSVNTSQWVQSPPKLLCDGALTGISLSTQGQAVTRRVGLYRVYGGWFQGQDGDVAAKNGITVDIPATCVEPGNQASCGSFTSGGSVYTPLIRNSVNSTAGVAYATSIGIGTAPSAVVSNTSRKTNSTYGGRNYDYGFYDLQTSRLTRQNWNGASKPAGDADGEVFVSSGNITIGSDWNLGGAGTDERVFIVHDGNVSVTSNLNVVQGSYLGIVASGNITFAANVSRAEGVFIADNINISSTGNTATEVQFVGEGSFIGWNGVSLVRNRGALNNTGPAELFIFRPDFVVNAFDGVKAPEVKWQEVAP